MFYIQIFYSLIHINLCPVHTAIRDVARRQVM